MTVEEALVALLAAVAGALLFVGLAQALDGRPPVRRRSRDQLRSGGARRDEALSARPAWLPTGPAVDARARRDFPGGASPGSLRLASRYPASDLPPAG